MAVEHAMSVDMLWEKYFLTYDTEVKNQIVFYYLDIVRDVVNRLMPHYQDYSEKDELMNCGVLGLIDAIDRFDHTLGVRFQTYAAVRVRGEIIDYMRKQDWAPTSLRKRINDIEKASQALESVYGRKPTDEELANFLGYNVVYIRKIKQKTRMFNVVYLEALPSENVQVLHSGLGKGDPYQLIEDEFMTETLRKMIDDLPERKRTVIKLRYYEGLPIKSIAQILQISESRVSQIHTRTLLDMRMYLLA